MQLFERVTVPSPKTKTKTKTKTLRFNFQDEDRDQDLWKRVSRRLETKTQVSRTPSLAAPYGRSDLLHFKYIRFGSNFLLGNKYFVTSTSTSTSTEGSSTNTSTSTLHASTSTSTSTRKMYLNTT